MDLSHEIAAALGFPKLKYVAVERERRWLCRDMPREIIAETDAITDLYVTATWLRLREARPIDGSPPMRRLTRKVDVDTRTRLITSIYLAQSEFELLATALNGVRIRKLRHRLHSASGVTVAVDEFQEELTGLILVEAEFETAEAMAAFPKPGFALREVTDDPRYAGGHLAAHGLPPIT